jgi:hypothetical protein
MLFAYYILAVALLIEIVGAYYSITGLAAIFSGAVIPILIMGGSLELGKVTAAVWLKNNWDRAGTTYKLYLLPAVAMLMLITSMGIFGYLSKAHNDRALVSGDVTSKLEIYDEKIKTAKENIEADRKQIKQMDEAVDQVMARSTTEGGADKSNAIRRSQARDRASLAKDIEANQKTISQLNDQAAPIRAEVRKVEADVGPIKYIAKLIYSENPDANILEKAVTWVIMIIVAVFDPLALVLILAAQQSIRWAQGEESEEQEQETVESWFDRARKRARFWDQEPEHEDLEGFATTVEQLEPMVDQQTHIPPEDYYRAMGLFDTDVALTDPYISDSRIQIPEPEIEIPPEIELDFEEWKEETSVSKDPHPPGWMFVAEPPPPEPEPETEIDPLGHIEIPEIHPDDQLHILAKKLFMSGQPDVDERLYHAQHQAGDIDRLPWHEADHINGLPISDRERKQLIERFATASPPPPRFVEVTQLEADNEPNQLIGEVRGFGTAFPTDVNKGDMFLRVDRLPSSLYKFNGTNWIEVDKELSDQHAYDDAYIDHLISKISTGEYDPELLSNAERDSIERRLNTTRQG